MIYFTKYLPVEGEPQKGDMTILAGEIAPYNEIVPIGLKVGNSELTYSKVKLFLCSRDNPNQGQEIITQGIKEGQEFNETEKEYLALGYVVEI